MLTLRVNEIFDSLQGEVDGYGEMGCPTTFIRLQGCNLRCLYCDTSYAREVLTSNGEEMTIDEIIAKLDENRMPKVTITGGEPLLRPVEVQELAERIAFSGRRVTIETNGTQRLPQINKRCRERVRFVVDYKLHSSGMEKFMQPTVFTALKAYDTVKCVIGDESDFHSFKILLKRKAFGYANVAVSPLEGGFWEKRVLARKVLEDKDLRGVQYSLQLHKLLNLK